MGSTSFYLFIYLVPHSRKISAHAYWLYMPVFGPSIGVDLMGFLSSGPIPDHYPTLSWIFGVFYVQ